MPLHGHLFQRQLRDRHPGGSCTAAPPWSSISSKPGQSPSPRPGSLAYWSDGNCYGDYSFHMAVTDFNESHPKGSGATDRKRRHHLFQDPWHIRGFDDRRYQMVGLMQEVKERGGMVTVHATNGDMIDSLIAKHRAEGKLSPLYHWLSQPEVTESEASAGSWIWPHIYRRACLHRTPHL